MPVTSWPARLTAVAAALAAIPPAAFAQADGAVWSAGRYSDDAGGGEVAYLQFGVPETDAVAFVAECRQSAGGPSIPVMLMVDWGDGGDGSPVVANISANGFQATYAAEVAIESEESAGVLVPVGIEDPLWQVLVNGGQASFSALDRQAATVPLDGAAAPVAEFLEDCAKLFAAHDAGVAVDQLLSYDYTCEDGTSFSASFDNSRSYSVAVLSLPGQPQVPLVQVVSGSGARYSNGEHTLHTKADDALLTLPDGRELSCRAL